MGRCMDRTERWLEGLIFCTYVCSNVVRLGEQEIGNHRDCDLIDENDCALVVQDYDVEHFIKHHSHDIGLIRLAGNVVYEGT